MASISEGKDTKMADTGDDNQAGTKTDQTQTNTNEEIVSVKTECGDKGKDSVSGEDDSPKIPPGSEMTDEKVGHSGIDSSTTPGGAATSQSAGPDDNDVTKNKASVSDSSEKSRLLEEVSDNTAGVDNNESMGAGGDQLVSESNPGVVQAVISPSAQPVDNINNIPLINNTPGPTEPPSPQLPEDNSSCAQPPCNDNTHDTTVTPKGDLNTELNSKDSGADGEREKVVDHPDSILDPLSTSIDNSEESNPSNSVPGDKTQNNDGCQGQRETDSLASRDSSISTNDTVNSGPDSHSLDKVGSQSSISGVSNDCEVTAQSAAALVPGTTETDNRGGSDAGGRVSMDTSDTSARVQSSHSEHVAGVLPGELEAAERTVNADPSSADDISIADDNRPSGSHSAATTLVAGGVTTTGPSGSTDDPPRDSSPSPGSSTPGEVAMETGSDVKQLDDMRAEATVEDNSVVSMVDTHDATEPSEHEVPKQTEPVPVVQDKQANDQDPSPVKNTTSCQQSGGGGGGGTISTCPPTQEPPSADEGRVGGVEKHDDISKNSSCDTSSSTSEVDPHGASSTSAGVSQNEGGKEDDEIAQNESKPEETNLESPTETSPTEANIDDNMAPSKVNASTSQGQHDSAKTCDSNMGQKVELSFNDSLYDTPDTSMASIASPGAGGVDPYSAALEDALGNATFNTSFLSTTSTDHSDIETSTLGDAEEEVVIVPNNSDNNTTPDTTQSVDINDNTTTTTTVTPPLDDVNSNVNSSSEPQEDHTKNDNVLSDNDARVGISGSDKSDMNANPTSSTPPPEAVGGEVSHQDTSSSTKETLEERQQDVSPVSGEKEEVQEEETPEDQQHTGAVDSTGSSSTTGTNIDTTTPVTPATSAPETTATTSATTTTTEATTISEATTEASNIDSPTPVTPTIPAPATTATTTTTTATTAASTTQQPTALEATPERQDQSSPDQNADTSVPVDTRREVAAAMVAGSVEGEVGANTPAQVKVQEEESSEGTTQVCSQGTQALDERQEVTTGHVQSDKQEPEDGTDSGSGTNSVQEVAIATPGGEEAGAMGSRQGTPSKDPPPEGNTEAGGGGVVVGEIPVIKVTEEKDEVSGKLLTQEDDGGVEETGVTVPGIQVDAPTQEEVLEEGAVDEADGSRPLVRTKRDTCPTPGASPQPMPPPASNVVMRKKPAVRVYTKPEGKDVQLQQKIDHEIKMRDGTAKLLAASKHPSQLIEAAKNLLTSNARMIAYMSELQRRKTDEVLNRNKVEQATTVPCTAKLAVSDIRIPLMWKETDHFKNRGDHRRFAVFCLWKIGTQIQDTVLLKDVDRSMTDLTFDDVIIFEDVGPDFECNLEVYCHKLTDDHSTSTPRRIRKKFNDISTSVGRSVGRRLSGMKDDPEFMSNMIVGPKFEMIASAALSLNDLRDSIGIFDLQTNPAASNEGGSLDLPLFGNFCCRLAGQPLCMMVEAAAGHLNVKPGPDAWKQLWCILGKQSFHGWASERDQKQDKSPILDLIITSDARVKKLEGKNEQGYVIQLSAWSNGRRRHYQLASDQADDRDTWLRALQQHVLDIASWKQACESVMEIEQTTPPNRRSFFDRHTRSSLYDETPWEDSSDSPMTRILNRLELDEDANSLKPPV